MSTNPFCQVPRFQLPWLGLLLLGITFASSQAAERTLPSIDRVRFQPLPGKEKLMTGGVFSGSNVSRTEGFETLAEIKTLPQSGEWTEIKIENPAKKVYRWLRFMPTTLLAGKLAKVEFYACDQMLAGEGKGTAYTSFVKDVQDDSAVGYDIHYIAAPRRPAFKLEGVKDQPGRSQVTINAEPKATIRYTLDGTWPGPNHGEIYERPIPVEKTTTVTAVALLPGLAPSLPVVATYSLPGQSRPGLQSAHVGNSLTGTTGGFWRYAQTAGYEHKSEAFLRGGALTREVWALASGEYVKDKVAVTKEETALQRGSVPWASFWSKVGKVDLITLQPRDFDLDKEIAAEIAFIKQFREKSPELQPWLYCEWVEQRRQRPSDRGEVPSYQMKKTFPALTWEESMGAMLLYVEELQHRLTATYQEGKRPRVLPTALAMGWLKNKIDHGQFGEAKPGTFYEMLFSDQVHPNVNAANGSANGAYLVDMTWYPAFYREPSEGKVLPIETTYTPEQARIVERLGWDVIKNYPDCGLYEEGATPCGVPEITSDGRTITLRSATPGAWFRYTLDGTEPTRTRGYVYCGIISVQPGIQVKAVAYKSGMADSGMTTFQPQ